jgi:DTW domain-containing protein YfiP
MPPNIIPVDPRAKMKYDRANVCANCFRPKEKCICNRVLGHDNRLRVVVLQHPQEQYKALNSARLVRLLLKNSDIFVGLSWSNFKKVAGENELPSQWGVLYLKPDPNVTAAPLMVVNRKKQPVEDTTFLKGIIALDGSWKQSKALWWRNSWLLKLNRISLNPSHPSLRPQVKNQALSTIEAVAFTLEHLGENPAIVGDLREQYRKLIIDK